ncbi:MAG TPA: AgmX/PglI C-terminal domain-containing protein [Polyangia bacterium]|nr:AgmX/PglI C-terminal domain-containing protein [Polyangia bacterium]
MVHLLLLLMLVPAIPAKTDGVGAIDAACEAPGGRVGVRRARIFVEVSGAVLPRPRQGQWREIATEAELHALAAGERPPNTEAIVRGTRGGTLVSMYFQDASANWAHVVDYCFRAEGPLARLRGTFNSFTAAERGPGIRRRRTIYFDAQGAVLRAQTRVSDIDTDRPLNEPRFTDEDDPLYPSVRALPFAADLLPPVAADADSDRLATMVRERLPAVKGCYQRALKHAPGLAGKAVGRWTVEAAGSVSAFSWQTDEMKSAAFTDCAQKVIESWRFPARDEPKVVTFPFVFGVLGADISLAP